MKQLTCEMCGSNDLVKQDGVFVCQSCGCKYSVEEAKKMMVEGTVEVTGTVKVEGINGADKLYSNIKSCIEMKEITRAEEICMKFIDAYPNDYRAWWAMIETVTNNFTVFETYIRNRQVWKQLNTMYFEGHTSFAKYFNFIRFFNNAIALCGDEEVRDGLRQKYEAWYKKRYDYLCNQKLTSRDRLPHISYIEGLLNNEQFYQDGIENADKCNKKIGVFKVLGIDEKNRTTTTTYGYDSDTCTLFFKKFIFVNGCIALIEYENSSVKQKLKKEVYFTNIVNKNINDYLSTLPDGDAKEEFKGGCYIATCVYGSYDCPQVWTLRRFRDNTLAETMLGRAFIRTYYAISPTLVKWFGDTSWFKKMWKGTLDRMVFKLLANGVEDTPYQDRNW